MAYNSTICLSSRLKAPPSSVARDALLFTMYYYCRVTIICQVFHSKLTLLNCRGKGAGMILLVPHPLLSLHYAAKGRSLFLLSHEPLKIA